MNPYLAAILTIPLALGTLVLLRLAYVAYKLARAKLPGRRAQRGTNLPVIPMLDEPMPCTTCGRLDTVRVARDNFQEMPYVEHFLCEGCGTRYLGPHQNEQVQKRLEAQKAMRLALAGVAPKKTFPKKGG